MTVDSSRIEALTKATKATTGAPGDVHYEYRLLEALEAIKWKLAPILDTTCLDCDEDGNGYMILNEVWEEACPEQVQLRIEQWKYQGTWEVFQHGRCFLCMPCVEIRLGRKLTAADFNFELPINKNLRRGMTL